MEKDESVSMAGMAKDISYMRETISEMKITLELLTSSMVTRNEVDGRFDRVNTELDKRFEGAHARLDTKLDKEEFYKFQNKVEDHIGSGNIKWGAVIQTIITIVLSGAVVGAIAFAVQSGKL